MAYNEAIAQQIRMALGPRRNVREQRMFGGLSFLIDGKMVAGVMNDDLVVRADPNDSAALLQQTGVRPMDFTGRPSKGFFYLSPEAYPTDEALTAWLEQSIAFVATQKSRKK